MNDFSSLAATSPKVRVPVDLSLRQEVRQELSAALAWLNGQSLGVVMLLTGVLVAGVGLADYLAGPTVSVALFYVIPIVFATWFGGAQLGLTASLVSVTTWLLVNTVGDSDQNLVITVRNTLVRCLLFFLVTAIVSMLKRSHERLESMVAEKTALLAAAVAEHRKAEEEVLRIANHEQLRIAHDLHDGLGQSLTQIALRSKALHEDLSVQAPSLASVAQEITRLVNDTNRYAQRLAHGLDPLRVELEGLTPALQHLARQTAEYSNIPCQFSANYAGNGLDTAVEAHLFRVAQEAVNNAVKHSNAARIQILLEKTGAEMVLSIRDDGAGFDPASIATLDGGMGLRIMPYRARAIGAEFQLLSAIGKGTEIRLRMAASDS